MFGSKRKTTDATISVTISKGSGGDRRYAFRYAGTFVDEKGNMDFTVDGARKKAVRVKFEIAAPNALGAKFLTQDDNAIWIVEKDKAGPDGCPQGPYKGDQFTGIATQGGGRTLSLTDKNDDGKVYRYALRFMIDGDTVVDDPEVRNGSDHP